MNINESLALGYLNFKCLDSKKQNSNNNILKSSNQVTFLFRTALLTSFIHVPSPQLLLSSSEQSSTICAFLTQLKVPPLSFFAIIFSCKSFKPLNHLLSLPPSEISFSKRVLCCRSLSWSHNTRPHQRLLACYQVSQK